MKSITVALFLVAIVSVLATESDFLFSKEKKLKEGPSQEYIGWLLKEKQAVLTEDLSKDFGPMTTRNISRFFLPNINAIKDKFHNKKTWDQVGLNVKIIQELAQKYHFLIIPGLLTKFYPFYLDGMFSVCTEVGFQCTRAKIDTTGSIELNAKTIRDVVMNEIGPLAKKDGKKIVFIGHSKGVTDSMDSLMKYPEVAPYMGGAINLQGPLGGAAIANDLEHGNVSEEIVDFVISKVLHGDKESMRDLAYPLRQNFYRGTKYNLLDVPMLNFVSYVKGFSALFLLDEYTNLRYHALGDAMVLDVDGILPGQYFIQAAGFDHAAPGFSTFPNASGYHNGHLMLSLLYLWYAIQVKKAF